MAHTATHPISREMQQCIEECMSCHAICLETAHHCLHLAGKHADPHHIGLLLDCAESCQTSANFMLRGSSHSAHTCGVCAAVCRDCEQSCRSMGTDDDLLQKCADACASCAESCQKMAAMAH